MATAQVRSQAVAKYLAGTPTKVILAELGVSRTTLYEWLAQRGVLADRAVRGNAHRRVQIRLSQDEWERLEAMASAAQGVPVSVMARRLVQESLQ